ncbi:MAG: YraN family protein, partial [Candidatus Rickettsiella isopodorum]
GSSLESVNLIKQNKIIKTAEYYLLSQQLSEKITCRFDVVGVKPPTNKLLGNISKLDSAQVEWIKNAFSR